MFQFKFTCPQCHHEVMADESMCGSVAECPFCAKGIVVPRVNKTRDVVSTGKNLRLRDGASEPSEDPSATSILFASDERASATTYARGSEDKKPFGGIRRPVGTYPDPVTPKEQVPYSRPSQAAARNGSDSRQASVVVLSSTVTDLLGFQPLSNVTLGCFGRATTLNVESLVMLLHSDFLFSVDSVQICKLIESPSFQLRSD